MKAITFNDEPAEIDRYECLLPIGKKFENKNVTLTFTEVDVNNCTMGAEVSDSVTEAFVTKFAESICEYKERALMALFD